MLLLGLEVLELICPTAISSSSAPKVPRLEDAVNDKCFVTEFCVCVLKFSVAYPLRNQLFSDGATGPKHSPNSGVGNIY
eukprot:1082004-Amphidinium_carterae.1